MVKRKQEVELIADKDVFDNALKKAISTSGNLEIVLHSINYNNYDFSFDNQSETIWGTQEQIAKLFNVDKSVISRHINNIIEEKEVEMTSIAKFAIDTPRGKYPVTHYDLDIIIAVGYRVNSKKATEFRKWATNVLKQYIKDGYAIDRERLREDPKKLSKLAAEIRELRAEEKNIYASVRECFKLASSDYDPNSQEVKTFYALLQDKFHHAITKMSSCKLIMDRADHKQSNMGLQTFKGDFPTLSEAQVGKNYLTQNEIYRMHLLSEQFLLYAESTALMNKKMTMKLLIDYLDKLLELNGYEVFAWWEEKLKKNAMEHAKREYALLQDIEKLKLIGLEVNIDSFEEGMYDEQLNALKNTTLAELKNQLEKASSKKLEYKK